MPLKRLISFPGFFLNSLNSPVQTGLQEPITGIELPSGSVLGDYFDLTEAEANNYTAPGTAAANQCHAGRYRLVQVDPGATAGNIAAGRIGLMATAAKGLNIVTSYDQGLANATGGFHPVVFLNTVLPGNYCFVQELGIANVAYGTVTGATTVGAVVVSAATGVSNSLAAATALTSSNIGQILGFALDAPATSTTGRIMMEEVAVYQG